MMKRIKIDDSAGFSFVELMVVIALIGTLSAIGLPSFLASLPEKRLKNAARNLYVDLQKARLLAVKENTDVAFTFNIAAGQYSYTSGGATITESLSDYGAVQYGCGVTTTNSWRTSPDDSIPTSGVTGNMIFTNLGEQIRKIFICKVIMIRQSVMRLQYQRWVLSEYSGTTVLLGSKVSFNKEV